MPRAAPDLKSKRTQAEREEIIRPLVHSSACTRPSRRGPSDKPGSARVVEGPLLGPCQPERRPLSLIRGVVVAIIATATRPCRMRLLMVEGDVVFRGLVGILLVLPSIRNR